jgi:hypothetical protein
LRLVLTGLLALVTLSVPSTRADAVEVARHAPATNDQHDLRSLGIPKDKTKRCPRFERKFREHGLPVEVFSYIAWRESRCNPRAHNKTRNRNGSQDLGLVQVNDSWKTVTSQVCKTPWGKMHVLFDVDCNLAVARHLYLNGGLGHWSL